MKKTLVLLAVGLSSALLFSCQNAASSKDALKDTQLCLNTSAPADARGCLAKISSDLSTAAYKLRCSAIFISEGYNTPVAFTGAFDQINSPANCAGCSSTVNAIGSLNFHSGVSLSTNLPAQDRNRAVAAEAFLNCSQSGSNIYTQISSLFQIGTLASMLAYKNYSTNTTPTPAQIKAALADLSSDPAAPAILGTIATTTYASTCQNLSTAPAATVKFCSDLGAAVAGGSTPVLIGQCLLNKLQNPAATCP